MDAITNAVKTNVNLLSVGSTALALAAPAALSDPAALMGEAPALRCLSQTAVSSTSQGS